MKRYKFFVLVGLILFFFFVIGIGRAAVYSDPSGIVQDNYTLDGEINNNVNIVARTVTMEEGNTVNGNVSIMAANKVALHGTINGNLSIFGPSSAVDLRGLKVHGNVAICAHNVEGLDSAAVDGNVNDTDCNINSILSGHGAMPRMPLVNNYLNNPVARFFQTVFMAVVAAALAGLAFAVFPDRMGTMIEATLTAPVKVATVGFTSLITAVVGSGLYFLTIVFTLGLMCVFLPVVGLGWLALTAALIVGWLTIAAPIGDIVLRRLNIQTSPMVTAVFGALLVTLAYGILQFIPCINGLATLSAIALASAGLGAVIITRLGTRAYPEYIMTKAKVKHV